MPERIGKRVRPLNSRRAELTGAAFDHEPTLLRVNDSKQIAHEDRGEICRHIMSRARAVAVGVIEPHTIDRAVLCRGQRNARAIEQCGAGVVESAGVDRRTIQEILHIAAVNGRGCKALVVGIDGYISVTVEIAENDQAA